MTDETDYWLSFHIKNERGRDGRTYEQRYQALTTAVDEVASLTWSETTSFYLLRSQYSIDQICGHLKPAIDLTRDTVLIRVLAQGSARVIGVYYDGNLNKFLPYLK